MQTLCAKHLLQCCDEPQRAADKTVDNPCCHGAAAYTCHVSILDGEQICTEAEQCIRAALYGREARPSRTACVPGDEAQVYIYAVSIDCVHEEARKLVEI